MPLLSPVPSRPWPRLRWWALTGALLTAALTWSAGRIGPPGWAHPFTRWGGLLSPTGVWPEIERWPGIVLAIAVVGIAVLGLLAAGPVRAAAWTTRDVWTLGAAWAAPLVAGPPALSNDVFSYVAQGAVAATGVDPGRVSSMALGWNSPLVQAVDPQWRQTPSPYGPLATLLQREVVEAAGGHPVLAVLALRLVALTAVALIAALAVSSVQSAGRPEAAPFVVLLTWASPLLLLHVVAAIHLEGVLVVLVLLAVRAVLTRTVTGDVVAVLAATGAAAVKLPVGGVVVAVVVADVALRAGRPGARLPRAVGAAVGAVAAYAACCAVTGSGWNVLAVVRAPAAGRTPAAPATMIATVLTPLGRFGLGDAATWETFGRSLTAFVAVLVVVWLVATVRRRPIPLTTGLALLVLAVGSPVLYPWYLVWSVPLLAITAVGPWRRRLALLSALGAVMTVQGLTHAETWVLASTVVTGVVVAVVVTEQGLRRRCRAAVVRTWSRTVPLLSRTPAR